MAGEIGAKWHIGKEIPLALIGTILAQTIAAVWWAAGISYDIRNVKADVVILKTKVDVLLENRSVMGESLVTINGHLQRNADHNAEQDRRIMDIEARVRELERRSR